MLQPRSDLFYDLNIINYNRVHSVSHPRPFCAGSARQCRTWDHVTTYQPTGKTVR